MLLLLNTSEITATHFVKDFLPVKGDDARRPCSYSMYVIRVILGQE